MVYHKIFSFVSQVIIVAPCDKALSQPLHILFESFEAWMETAGVHEDVQLHDSNSKLVYDKAFNIVDVQLKVQSRNHYHHRFNAPIINSPVIFVPGFSLCRH